jgi:3-hydroxybutyryl-CoA dehydrogenase
VEATSSELWQGSFRDASLKRVGIVGCGLMGSGIAEVTALAGLDVVVRVRTDAATETGQDRIERSLKRGVEKGKFEPEAAAAALHRIAIAVEWDGFEQAGLVVEAVHEDVDLKKRVFEQLDRLTRPETVLATTTSSVPVMKLAAATSRPERILGLHFFNPVPIMDLVEIVPTLASSDETVALGREFVEETLGKQAILARDSSGFVVNRLLIPYILDAIRLLESRFATEEDIDRGMVLGCGHPMGPLALADLIGLDTLHAIARSLYEEFKETLYAPPPLLSRMLQAGRLGRKAGRGFYEYVS